MDFYIGWGNFFSKDSIYVTKPPVDGHSSYPCCLDRNVIMTGDSQNFGKKKDSCCLQSSNLARTICSFFYKKKKTIFLKVLRLACVFS